MHNHNYAQAVVQLLQNRLKLNIDIGDIMDVHLLPTRNKIPPLIVKFMRPFNLEQVLKARRNLKGRGIGISEDLTRRNIQLLNGVKNSPGVVDAWTQKGQIWCKFGNEKKMKVDLFKPLGQHDDPQTEYGLTDGAVVVN